MIQTNIYELVNYGIENHLMEEADRVYITNCYLQLFKLDSYNDPTDEIAKRPLQVILDDMLDFFL